MWIYILAFLYCLPLLAGALHPLQQDAPTIFGKATANDVDLLRVRGGIVVLRGVEAVAYKRRAEEREPVGELQARLDRGPVRCERLENYNGTDWYVGTCYLLVGKGTEIDLNQWVVASRVRQGKGRRLPGRRTTCPGSRAWDVEAPGATQNRRPSLGGTNRSGTTPRAG